MRQFRRDSRRGEQRSVFLCCRTQGTLRERDAGTLVGGAHGNDVWHGPEGSMSSVNEDWMLEYVFRAYVTRSGEDGDGTPDDLVCGCKFARVLRLDTGDAQGMLTAADDRWTAVRRGGGPEVS
eukprot:2185089-Pleurochrysis_carterae.AAC.1